MNLRLYPMDIQECPLIIESCKCCSNMLEPIFIGYQVEIPCLYVT